MLFVCYPHRIRWNAENQSKQEERGLIVTEHTEIITRRGIKRNGSLLYTLIPMPEVVERYYEQQFTALDSTAERRRIQAKLSARQSA